MVGGNGTSQIHFLPPMVGGNGFMMYHFLPVKNFLFDKQDTIGSPIAIVWRRRGGCAHCPSLSQSVSQSRAAGDPGLLRGKSGRGDQKRVFFNDFLWALGWAKIKNVKDKKVFFGHQVPPKKISHPLHVSVCRT